MFKVEEVLLDNLEERLNVLKGQGYQIQSVIPAGPTPNSFIFGASYIIVYQIVNDFNKFRN